MTSPEDKFFEIGDNLEGAEKSSMFGKSCYKIKGKAFMCFYSDCMVFKLGDTAHQKALNLEGSILFDPSGKGRPMKEWVQVSLRNQDLWPEFAAKSLDYVKSNAKD